MSLPFEAPLAPMLAKATQVFPEDEGWLFEPKWDGFRALIFRDGGHVHIQSRDGKPLERYFPELLEPLTARLPERCILDGELVIAGPSGLDFEALQLRIHPAASRVEKLAVQTPASYVAFDLLALGDDDLRDSPQARRRELLESSLAGARPPIFLTPVTRDLATARDWFTRFEGAGLDGVMAKRVDGIYEPKKRAMLKLKHRRTAECVVAGFRWHKKGPGTLVGSLLLGLYADDGKLQHVGITSTFKMTRRAELVEELADLREGALEGHPWSSWASPSESEQRRPGMTSRWSKGKDLRWEPLRIERVVEVVYDQLLGTRFRHGTTFVRWRNDKSPDDCRYDQLEATAPFELGRIFHAPSGANGS